MMKLEIRWHPRIGDAIVQRGIFRHYLQLFKPTDVCVPATPEAVGTIRQLYGMDAHMQGAQLFVREVSFDPREHDFYNKPFWADSLKMTIGAACIQFDAQQWDRSFYDQAGLDPAKRFEAYSKGAEDFPPEVFSNRAADNQRAYLMKQRRPGRRLALFHETREKRIPHEVRTRYANPGWKCLNISPDLGPSVLYWAPIMMDADAMHLVDSGPANLANSLQPGKCEIVIYAQDTPPPSMLNPKNNIRVECVGTWKP